MGSKSRSRSGSRKASKAPSRILAQPSEEFSVISDGIRDTFQTTINRTGYLADISSAAIIPTTNKALKYENTKIAVNELEHKSVHDKIVNSKTLTDWNSTVLVNKPVNIIDKKYQSCCIDDTVNGTFLLNNTELMIDPDIRQTTEIHDRSTIKNEQLIDGPSIEASFKVPKLRSISLRSKSRSFKKESLKDENAISEANDSKILNVGVTGCNQISESAKDLAGNICSTTSAPPSTSGIYSEFKNEYEKLLNGSKILGEISSSGNDKTNIPPQNERGFTKIKKSDNRQPSPIPKEECTEISEIDSSHFKKHYPEEKKNTSAKYNRLTLAQQLEKTFKENNVHLNTNNSKLSFLVDQFNHTYRNSLEETLPNFNIECLVNSTCKDDINDKTIYCETKTLNHTTPYLSNNYAKQFDLNSIVSECEKHERLAMNKHFPIVNDCATEMVRQCSNPKTSTVIITPTIISDIGIKKSEFTNDINAITTTNTRDICSIDDDSDTKIFKYGKIDETFNKSTRQLDERKNETTKIAKNSVTALEETQQMEIKPFIDPSIIDDFRDEMIQSVNDVCDFLSHKVKNNTAVNLVEERFMENARFLYKFFFHSCRESN